MRVQRRNGLTVGSLYDVVEQLGARFYPPTSVIQGGLVGICHLRSEVDKDKIGRNEASDHLLNMCKQSATRIFDCRVK